MYAIAFPRRSSKTVSGATTQFLYDGGNAVQELSSTSTPLANIVAGGVDQWAWRTEGAATKHFLTDALGSTRALTDDAKAIGTRYQYEPFGETTTSGAVSANPSQYTGRENDGTGLYYYRARYYHPTLKRFISEDPIGLAGGINYYEYVSANPMSNTDPSGNVVPIAVAYARCMLSCMAMSAAGELFSEGSLDCFDASGVAADCALDCLNPLNWGGKGPKNLKPKSKPKPPGWKDYPDKRGKFENHHIDPKYLGGNPNGPTSRIDAEYHQNITNRFRDLHPYGGGRLPPAERQRIMNEVYRDLPIPGYP
jgi:RHS repeat-associated protein